LTIPSEESTFLVGSAKGLSFPSIGEEKGPAVSGIASNYLIRMEGPFWREVRGAGLAYSFNIITSLEDKMNYFILQRASNVVKAFEKCMQIIDDIISEKTLFDPLALEEARSGEVFSILRRESTVSEASLESLYDYLRCWEQQGSHRVLKKLPSITFEDVKAYLKEYIKPLFSFGGSITTITTNPQRSGEILQAMKQLGFPLTLIESYEQFYPLE